MPELRVDRRKGSGELAKYFHLYGIQPITVTLDFGDFDWSGQGWSRERQEPVEVTVVVERKRIDDLIDSMKSKRLAGYQLKGMAENYDYGYLFVEGIWRPSDEGFIEINRNGNWIRHNLLYEAVDGYLDSIALRGGMVVVKTGNEKETVRAVVNRYKRWQEPWLSHRSHDAVYAPTNDASEWQGSFSLLFTPRDVTLCEKMACQLPGLEQKARWVAKHFGSAADMARAGKDRWAQIVWQDRNGDKKKLGAETARKIEEALRKDERAPEDRQAQEADGNGFDEDFNGDDDDSGGNSSAFGGASIEELLREMKEEKPKAKLSPKLKAEYDAAVDRAKVYEEEKKAQKGRGRPKKQLVGLEEVDPLVD